MTRELLGCSEPVCGQTFHKGVKKAGEISFSLKTYLIVLAIITVSLNVGKTSFEI